VDARTILRDGLLERNPGLVQLLGLCPLLAVSNSVANALGLGLATLAGEFLLGVVLPPRGLVSLLGTDALLGSQLRQASIERADLLRQPVGRLLRLGEKGRARIDDPRLLKTLFGGGPFLLSHSTAGVGLLPT